MAAQDCHTLTSHSVTNTCLLTGKLHTLPMGRFCSNRFFFQGSRPSIRIRGATLKDWWRPHSNVPLCLSTRGPCLAVGSSSPLWSPCCQWQRILLFAFSEAPDRFKCKLSLWLSLQRARGAEAVSSKCVCFPNTSGKSLGSVPNSPHVRAIPRKCKRNRRL